jgi:hypothetical protein
MSPRLEGLASDRARHRPFFLGVARECCSRLFASYGYPLRSCAPAGGTALTYFAVIEFRASGLQGSLVLGSSEAPLARSNPAKAVPIDDWIAELSNQLLGRVKNRLLLYALELQVATPVSLRDRHLSAARTHGRPSVSLAGQGGLVRVWVDLQLARGFRMACEPAPSRAGPEESQILFL